MSRSLKGASVVGMLALLVCCSRRTEHGAVKSVAIAELSFDDGADKTFTATIGFVSDDLIALGLHPIESLDPSGALTSVEWSGGKLRVFRTKPISDYRAFLGGLFPAGGGHFISSLENPPALLSRDLSSITEIPAKLVIAPVGGGTVAGDAHGFESWSIYRLAPTRALLRQGIGELLSLSQDVLVFRSNDEIRIEKMTGEPLGSFSVPPRSSCYSKALLLRSDRLYLNGCNLRRIVDFTGRTISEMPEPDGWGFRFGSTQDGHRILFDKYTRRISKLQRMSEAIESVLMLGTGPITTSKGEIIRVADTRTGKICFDLDTPEHQLGLEGEFHADISPSGRFVGIVSAGKLSIYSLPEVCK